MLTVLSADTAYAVSGVTLQQWGQEATSQIRNDFRLSSGLYAQSLTQRFPAYAWAQGIHFSALVAAAKVNPSAYLAEAESVANKMHSQYWCTSNGKSGYNASANNCGDRYYDDNAWIALALMELYEITGNTTYLNRAKAVVVFCMSGENGPGDTPNGGIRWHESGTCGANVCSTAPTCLANLMIYQATGIQQYLVDGLRLYNWLRTSGVQDSVTGLYWQSINCSGGIDKGFLGYETAPPLQATIRLYQITGDASYLTEAQRLAAAMETHFVNGTNHNLRQSGKWCGHDMTNAMVELYEVDHNPRWLNVAAGYLEYLYIYCKDAYGRYPTDWYNTGGGSPELLDNASVMRSFWKMAQTPGGTAPTYPVMFFENCSYSGWSAGFGAGSYTLGQLKACGIPDNSISSAAIAAGYEVTFYENDKFQGITLFKTSNDSCFVDEGWNDRATSIVIEETTRPAGYWQLNEDEGLVVTDSSTYNRNGTLLNMENSNWVLGRQCAGLSFDGVDDYVEIADFKGICGSRSRTCSAWVKTTASKDNPIMTWGSPQAGQKWMFRMDPDGTLAVAVWGGYIKSQQKINDGRWHHIAAVLTNDYTPAINEIKLYIDGMVETSPYASNAQAVNTSSANNVLIGGRIDGVSSRGFFAGLIDDVRIYIRPLSAAEIRDIYLADALIGDLSSDGMVDFADFTSIAQSWQKAGSCDDDITCDCTVDMDDFMILADEWLMQIE
ncbi:MAG TPA: glycoside hydrolase family 76 protein [Anaerohalosphaeraceae bacterium]|nr:glycoside hydrolase family 76 protein [Anaerohalosphaeraceae bacterium]